jgi:hypothetical protein
MHNRDMLWETKDHKKIKISDLSSDHLSNLIPHIERRIFAYIDHYGEEGVVEIKKNINQEIRFRKLNRIEISKDEDKLF